MCAFFAVCFVSQPSHAEQKTINLAADEWCPINCDPSKPDQGIGVDLVRKIFEPLGYKVTYKIMTWNDALDKVKSGKIDAIVGANQADSADLVFPHSPIGVVSDNIYMLASTKLSCQSLDCLRGLHIGLIEGYGYNKELEDFIAQNEDALGAVDYATGQDALEENIKKLKNGDLDAIVESSLVMDYELDQRKLGDMFSTVYSMPSEDIYIAFSPALKNSRELSELFDAGMDRLKSSDEVNKIYERYGLYTD